MTINAPLPAPPEAAPPVVFNPDKVPGHHFAASRFWRLAPSGMRRRWWLFRPFDLIARFWPQWRKRRGVLVVRMDGIGDMVLFRAALDDYAAVFGVAKTEITILGCHSWAALAGEIFAGYKFHAINEHAYAKRPGYRFVVNLRVRRLAPAVVINDQYMRRALMADSLAWVAGAPETISSLPFINERTRAEYKYYLSQTTRIVNTGLYPTHELIRHARFISALAGREIAPTVAHINWRDAPSLLSGPVPGKTPYVVLNPGSNEPGRRWPMVHYLAIARRLVAAGSRVVFIGTQGERTPDDPVAALVDEGASAAEENPVIDLTGQTTLPQLLDLIKGAAAMLGNDTGPAHLGIALGTPSVVVIGGGHFNSFVPYPATLTPATTKFVYERMDCYHCFWRCPYRTDRASSFPCVAAVSEDNVWTALSEVLEDKK